MADPYRFYRALLGGQADAGAGTNPPVGPWSNPPVGPRHNPPVGPWQNPPVGPWSNPPVGPWSNPPVSSGQNPPVGPWDNPPVGPGQPKSRLDASLSTWAGEPPLPWVGLTPDWVWSAGPDVMRAMALRSARARVLPPRDPRLPAGGPLRATANPWPALWRWGEEYRVSAAVGELLGRLAVVEGTQLWWQPPPSRRRLRPVPLFTLHLPPASYNYADQIDKVLRAAVEREERLPEILVQSQGIGVFFDSITGLSRGDAPRLRELLDAALQVVTHLLMQIKHHVAAWRPYQRSARVVPVIDTPAHGSLPSGHATQAMLTALLLSELLYVPGDARRVALDRLARRIAFNRVVAGVHFPMDSAAGAALARQLAATLVAAGRGYGPSAAASWSVKDEVELLELPPVTSPAPPPGRAARAVPGKAVAAALAPAVAVPGVPIWQQLWAAAETEIAQRRI
jgi:PAP2 superfamily